MRNHFLQQIKRFEKPVLQKIITSQYRTMGVQANVMVLREYVLY